MLKKHGLKPSCGLVLSFIKHVMLTIFMDDWSLEGPSSDKPQESIETEEFFIIESPTQTDVDKAIAKEKVCLFKAGIFSKPNPDEVKISGKIETTYKPYRIIEGAYLVRYLRLRKHELKLDGDVESVLIHGKEFSVNRDILKLSGIIGKAGSGFGISGTGLSFSFKPLESLIKDGAANLLGDKDFKLMEKKSIDIPDVAERVIHSHQSVFCFDAESATPIPAKDILSDIVGLKPKTKSDRPKNTKSLSDGKAVFDEVRKKLVKIPDDKKRILEQKLIIKPQVYFLPIIQCKVSYKGKQEDLRINGLTLKRI